MIDGVLHKDGARFFASGLVLSGKTLMETSTTDRSRVEAALIRTKQMGATSLRWNALLKGHELDWSPEGNLIGLKPGCAHAIRTVADMALAHGVNLQIVLGTAVRECDSSSRTPLAFSLLSLWRSRWAGVACGSHARGRFRVVLPQHFLRYGYGGADNVLHGISNRDRVLRIQRMLTSEGGINAFLDQVIDPIASALGGAPHPAVFGFLVFNEGCALLTTASALLRYAHKQRSTRARRSEPATRTQHTHGRLSAHLHIHNCTQLCVVCNHRATGRRGRRARTHPHTRTLKCRVR